MCSLTAIGHQFLTNTSNALASLARTITGIFADQEIAEIDDSIEHHDTTAEKDETLVNGLATEDKKLIDDNTDVSNQWQTDATLADNKRLIDVTNAAVEAANAYAENRADYRLAQFDGTSVYKTFTDKLAEVENTESTVKTAADKKWTTDISTANKTEADGYATNVKEHADDSAEKIEEHAQGIAGPLSELITNAAERLNQLATALRNAAAAEESALGQHEVDLAQADLDARADALAAIQPDSNDPTDPNSSAYTGSDPSAVSNWNFTPTQVNGNNQAAAEFALKQAQVERDTFASLADERATRDAARTAALDAEQLAHNAAETTRADLARQTYFANLYATAAADKSLTQADAATQLAYVHSLTAIGHQFVTDSVNADAAHADTIATTAFFAAYGERDGEAYSQDDRFADDQQAIADYEDALRSADHDYAVDFTAAQTARDDAAANAWHDWVSDYAQAQTAQVNADAVAQYDADVASNEASRVANDAVAAADRDFAVAAAAERTAQVNSHFDGTDANGDLTPLDQFQRDAAVADEALAIAKADAAKDFSDALSLAERDAKDNIALAGQINKQSTATDAQTEMTDRAATERDHTADRGAESNDHAASGHHTTETPDPPKPGMLDVTHMLDRPAVVFWGEANYVDFEILGDMYRPTAQQYLPTGSYGNHLWATEFGGQSQTEDRLRGGLVTDWRPDSKYEVNPYHNPNEPRYKINTLVTTIDEATTEIQTDYISQKVQSFEKPVNPHEVAPPSEPQPPEDNSGADDSPSYSTAGANQPSLTLHTNETSVKIGRITYKNLPDNLNAGSLMFVSTTFFDEEHKKRGTTNPANLEGHEYGKAQKTNVRQLLQNGETRNVPNWKRIAESILREWKRG